MSGQSFGGVAAKEFSDHRLVDPALRDFQNKVGHFFIGRSDVETVGLQKHDCRRRPHSLVAIQEWVVFHEMKQVGGSHLKQCRMQPLPAERRLRLGNRRLQQSAIPNTESAAVPCDLVCVDKENLVRVEKLRD